MNTRQVVRPRDDCSKDWGPGIEFNVGDVVFHRGGGLRDASGRHHANLVVVCLSPFTLASFDGVALFREDPRTFVASAYKATRHELDTAFERWGRAGNRVVKNTKVSSMCKDAKKEVKAFERELRRREREEERKRVARFTTPVFKRPTHTSAKASDFFGQQAKVSDFTSDAKRVHRALP